MGDPKPAHIGVNFSATQLSNTKLVDSLKWKLDSEDFTPERLAVEVLENIHVDSDTDPVVLTVRSLADLGCRIDLDDFGTGSASITGLRRFNAQRIKIDRSFVTDIDKRPDNQQMVSIMMNMAKGLGLEVLAEGVENDREIATLRHLGCHVVQGYFLAKPMSLEDTIAWLDDHNKSWTARRLSSRSIAV